LVVGENKIELPEPLPEHILMDANYLEKHKKTTQFRQFTVICDYFAVDCRHMNLKVGETVSGFS